MVGSKNLALLSLFIITDLLSFSSCAFFTQKEVVHTKVILPTLFYCPEPQKPIYEKLDENKPLVDSENLKKLLTNLTKQRYYLEGLEATIECYKEQVRQVNELSKENLEDKKPN